MDVHLRPFGSRCTKCGDWKPGLCFYSDARRPSGFQSWCRECTLIAKQADALRRREERAARQEVELARLVAEGRPCTKCGVHQSLDCFPKKVGRIDGRSSECSACRLARRRAVYRRDPIPKLAKRAEYVEANRQVLAEKRKRDRKELVDWYVKQKLIGKSKILKSRDLTPELIELKREQLRLQQLAAQMAEAATKERTDDPQQEHPGIPE